MSLHKLVRTANIMRGSALFVRTAYFGGLMIIKDSKEFGAAIRKRRKELEYTQAYIAEFSGLSVSFISDLERGKETAELGKVILLSNLLGMDIGLINRE